MSLSPGTRLGPYEVVSPIGAGGMGEVYRGRDVRLHRDAAIKVLAGRIAADDMAAARFEREARAIAALNHPNVCVIYDVGQQDGHHFLVMELLEGETLYARIARGPFAADAFLDHALALTDGLDAAHSRGLIHRDLKPANIFLTARDQIKILDFGLVKQLVSFDTVTKAADRQLTDPAMEPGTLAYMSPEQLRGEPLDARTDIFSLGLVLYEMATGRRAFDGSSDVVISAAILNHEPPPPREIQPDLPPKAEEIILKALEKDRDLRYQSVAEMRTDLKRLRRQSTGRGASESPESSEGAGLSSATVARPADSSDAQVITGLVKRHRVAAAALVIFVIGSVWGAATLSRRGSSAGTVGSDAFPHLDIQRVTLTGDITSGAISPDGKFIAYVRKNAGVWVRQISAENEIQIAPFVKERAYETVTLTPDGNSVDFAIAEHQTRELWRVPLLGGTPRRVVKDIWSAPGWSPDGRRMAFLRTKGPTGPTSLIVADGDGGNERVLTTRYPPADFPNSLWAPVVTNRPAWSPDGKFLMVVGVSHGGDALPTLTLIDPADGRELRSVVVKRGAFVLGAAWLDGARVLMNGGTSSGTLPGLWAGDLTADVWTPITREFTAVSGISVTADRSTAVATRTDRRSGIWLTDTFEKEGSIIVPETAARPSAPAIDNTGGIVYQAYAGYGVSVLYRLEPGATKPVVLGEYGYGGGFATSADGQFAVFGRGNEGLYRVNRDGTGLVTLIERNAGGPTITPDGKTVLFSPYGLPGLFSVPIAGGPVTQLSKQFVASAPSVSPDGRRMLFASGTPGRSVLCDLPGCANAKELELKNFQWAPDGEGIAYINEQDQRNLWQQPLDGRPARPLTKFTDARILEFGWSPDGKRLVLARGQVADDLVLLKGLR